MLHRPTGGKPASPVLRRLAILVMGLCIPALLLAAPSAPASAQRGLPAASAGEYQVAHRYHRQYRRSRKPAPMPEWLPEGESRDPLQIFVSLPDQQLTVYQGDKELVKSRVSSGKKGYSTPAGVFSILQKNRWHRSNIYSGAPMPFMQRLTWSGIALHASNAVPNYPASHGCVRLPPAFANQLFRVTEKGAHVIVANEKITQSEISHDKLFQPSPPAPKDYDLLEARRVKRLNGIEVEEEKARSTSPVRVLITRRTGRERLMDVQSLLNKLSFNAGDVDGWMGPDTAKAIRRFQYTYRMEEDGLVSQELIEKLYEVAGKGEPREGHLYVRQDFKPVFDMPVRIEGGEKPLGAHLFTAMHFGAGARETRWLAVTLTKGSHPNAHAHTAKKKQDDDEVVLTETAPGPSSAGEALSRVEIPAEARTRIEEMLMPGSSLAITNEGLSRETTPKGTDFVVLMQ